VYFPETAQVKVNFEAIGIKGKVKVRDLWGQKYLGTFNGNFSRELPQRKAELYRFTPTK
jgi:alpha-galactosidase